MKKYSISQLREIIKSLPDGAKPPADYGKVYNTFRGDNLGGRAWLMWFLDYLDDKPSIILPPEEKFPFVLET